MLRTSRLTKCLLNCRFRKPTAKTGNLWYIARASCDWKSSMPKHSLDARRNNRRSTANGQSSRPASRIKTIWGALNGTFVATIIGVAGAMGAAIIPTYLDSGQGSATAASSPSPRTGFRPYGQFPRPFVAPPSGGATPQDFAPPAGYDRVPCRPSSADPQHLAAWQGAASGQDSAGSQGSASGQSTRSTTQRDSTSQPSPTCTPCPVDRPSATYGPRLTPRSQPPSS
jgi:hypothetical protein